MKQLIFFLIALASAADLSYSQKMEPTEKDAKLNVSVINDDKKPREGETIFFESLKSKKTFSGITKGDGKFEILVPKGDKYMVKYKSFSGAADYTSIDVPNKKGELVEFDIVIHILFVGASHVR